MAEHTGYLNGWGRMQMEPAGWSNDPGIVFGTAEPHGFFGTSAEGTDFFRPVESTDGMVGMVAPPMPGTTQWALDQCLLESMALDSCETLQQAEDGFFFKGPVGPHDRIAHPSAEGIEGSSGDSGRHLPEWAGLNGPLEPGGRLSEETSDGQDEDLHTDNKQKRHYKQSCKRCKELKKKCDLQLPACGRCVKLFGADAPIMCIRHDDNDQKRIVHIDVAKHKQLSNVMVSHTWIEGYLKTVRPTSVFFCWWKQGVARTATLAAKTGRIRSPQEKIFLTALAGIGAFTHGHDEQGRRLIQNGVSLAQGLSQSAITCSPWLLGALFELFFAIFNSNAHGATMVGRMLRSVTCSHEVEQDKGLSQFFKQILPTILKSRLDMWEDKSAFEKYSEVLRTEAETGITFWFDRDMVDRIGIGMFTIKLSSRLSGHFYLLSALLGDVWCHPLVPIMRKRLTEIYGEGGTPLDPTLLSRRFLDPESPDYVPPPPLHAVQSSLEYELGRAMGLGRAVEAYVNERASASIVRVQDRETPAQLGPGMSDLTKGDVERVVFTAYYCFCLAVPLAEFCGRMDDAVLMANEALARFLIMDSSKYYGNLSVNCVLASFFMRHKMCIQLATLRQNFKTSLEYPDVRRLVFAKIIDEFLEHSKRNDVF